MGLSPFFPQIDFASTLCMNAVMDNMERTNQLAPEERPDQKGYRMQFADYAGGSGRYGHKL